MFNKFKSNAISTEGEDLQKSAYKYKIDNLKSYLPIVKIEQKAARENYEAIHAEDLLNFDIKFVVYGVWLTILATRKYRDFKDTLVDGINLTKCTEIKPIFGKPMELTNNFNIILPQMEHSVSNKWVLSPLLSYNSRKIKHYEYRGSNESHFGSIIISGFDIKQEFNIDFDGVVCPPQDDQIQFSGINSGIRVPQGSCIKIYQKLMEALRRGSPKLKIDLETLLTEKY